MENHAIKLVSLNTWGGRSLHPLINFLKRKSADVDVFCLQEVFDTDQKTAEERHPDEYICATLFRKVSAALPDFNGLFACFDDNPNRQSLAIFVRKTLVVQTTADFVVYRPAKPQETGSIVFSSRKLQYATIEMPGGACTIANFHGLFNNGPKTDTPERLEQSRSVKAFLDSVDGPKILCGDFNLLPDTESLKILENGMSNLVKDGNVQSTRTPLYRHYENPAEPNFADYILVSPEIKIRRFEVLPDLVSDHSPLSLEFSL